MEDNHKDFWKMNDRQKPFLLFSFCFMLLGIAIPLILLSEHPLTYILVLILFAVTAIPFFIAKSRRSFDLFEVINAIALAYFLYFGVRTIYLLNTTDFRAVRFFFVPEVVDRALLYVIIGVSLLLLGYYSNIPQRIVHRLPEVNFVRNNSRIFQGIIILYLVGMLSRGYFFVVGRRLDAPSTTNLIDYFFIFCQWSLILAIVFYFSSGRDIKASFFLWFVFLPIETFFTFFRPARGYFLPILLSPLMAYHYSRKRVSPLYLIIPFLVMFLIIFPVIPPMKSLAFQGYSPKFGTFFSDVGRMFEAVSITLGDLTFSEYTQNTYHEMMNRMPGIDTLTTVVRYTPEVVDFQYGKTIFSAFGFLIPQVVRENTVLGFLDTDVLSIGRRLGGIYFGANEEIAGVAITQVAELYLNFSILGILIGMFLLGIFYKTFYLYFIKENPHPFNLFIYMTLWFWVVMPELWFIHAYENFIKQLILLLMICWYLNGGRLFRKRQLQQLS